MVETVAAWMCLLYALFEVEPLWAIAAGVFAVAAQINLFQKKGGADNG